MCCCLLENFAPCWVVQKISPIHFGTSMFPSCLQYPQMKGNGLSHDLSIYFSYLLPENNNNTNYNSFICSLIILFMMILSLPNYAAKYKDKDNRHHRLSGLSSCYSRLIGFLGEVEGNNRRSLTSECFVLLFGM